MDSGQTAYILSQLSVGAVAAFLAIMLWSKTRDAAWMLVVMGTIFAYIEIVYSILGLFGIDGSNLFLIGSVPLISFVLPLLRMIFFIAAFVVMIVRHSRQN
jgi:membrane-bound ClpP family serine protease